MADTERNVGTHHGHLIPTSAPLLPWPIDPVVEPIHTRFEQNADMAPDGVAVKSGDGEPETTYRELNEQANGIAARLLTDVGEGTHRVAVLGDSALAHIASVLGILKAGKTAVPLHGANPDGRLEYILQHSESTAILAQAEDADRAAAITSSYDVQVIEPPSGVYENPAMVVDVDTTARIMYTSGSTGAPKGATQSHRYLFEKERFAQQFYAFGAEDRVSQLFPLSFAASTTHTLGALLNGGRLVPYEITELGIHHLADWLDEGRITALAMVPTLLRRFLQTVPDGRVFDSVRFVMVGAEVALRGDVELFAKHFPAECRFVHRLAATEAGEIAHYVLSDPNGLSDHAVIPAGFPGGGKELLILDDDGSPVPDGEIGELVVRSSNLSEGYWRDPELSARAFAVDPDDPWMRRYHTGDLARLRSDGALQHLGRRDGRIKISGFGVDLTEVEHVLLDGPGVVEGVVVAPEAQTGERRLVAYFIANVPFDEAALRAHFNSHLPGYMVPTTFVMLDQLPLTPRGKVDRKALSERDLEVVERPYTKPVTELEADLAAIWSEVLGMDQVGLDDDFFQLGGDSIQAYQLIAAVYHQLGVDLPASTLLGASTVRVQAELIASGSELSARSLVPFRETGTREPFFCVHGVGGGVIFLKKLLPDLDPDRPIYGLQPAILENEEASYLTVTEMAEGFIAEVRTVQPTGPYFIGGSCFGGLVAQEMARLLDERGDTVAFLGLIDPSSPHYQRAEKTRWQATKKQARKILLGRRDRRIRAEKQERWDRTQHLRKLHREAAKEHRPQPSSVPLHILGARKQSRRHEWMWGATSNGGITIEEFPTNHGEMYEPRNSAYIARMLNRYWSEVSEKPIR